MALDEDWSQSGLVGKTVAGRYLIVRELASDQRRTLYEAEIVEESLRVTLAVVRTDARAAAQRLRDAQKLRSLEHPGLVRVLDAGKLDSGELYIATERPAGTTLRALAAGKRVEQRRALLIVRQLLDALAAAHGMGTIHGDVKPENIVVLPGLGDDRVKLVDIGLSALTGPTRTGDPVYSAPEAALGAIDARADIYSAGAVLFELLTGHPPFFADDASALRRLHAYAPMQTLAQRAPGVSFAPALETLVATALTKSRDERFQTAADMLAALDPALQVIEDAAPTTAASEPGAGLDASLLLLANHLIPSSPSSNAAIDPVVPINVDRKVPRLSPLAKAELFVRRMLVRARPHKKIVGIVAGVVFVGLLVSIVTCAGGGRPDLAQRAKALVDKGQGRDAIALVEREVAAHPGDATTMLTLGDTQLLLNNYRQALTAYESAIKAKPALATQPKLIASLSRIAGINDTVTARSALDLVAARSGASGHAAIVSHASTNPHPETRHHAGVLAVRAGVAAQIDQIASWSLDLEQSDSCDERRVLVKKLAKTTDKRALPALEHAKTDECVGADAAAAIDRISGGARRP